MKMVHVQPSLAQVAPKRVRIEESLDPSDGEMSDHSHERGEIPFTLSDCVRANCHSDNCDRTFIVELEALLESSGHNAEDFRQKALLNIEYGRDMVGNAICFTGDVDRVDFLLDSIQDAHRGYVLRSDPTHRYWLADCKDKDVLIFDGDAYRPNMQVSWASLLQLVDKGEVELTIPRLERTPHYLPAELSVWLTARNRLQYQNSNRNLQTEMMDRRITYFEIEAASPRSHRDRGYGSACGVCFCRWICAL